MKKLFFYLTFIFVLLPAGAYAQELTASQKAFRDKIENYIKEEGYVPSIDPSDQSVTFKFEGDLLWITVEEENPFYVEMHASGFDTEDVDRKAILEACNYTNSVKRWGKAFVDDAYESISFTVEMFCPDIETFKKVFRKMVNIVASVKETTQDKYLSLTEK